MDKGARFEALEAVVAPARRLVTEHGLYGQLRTLDDVRTLAEHHVYAVWDFMSLLKFLQRELSCVSLPWIPPGDPEAARWVNEIVLAEESDELPGGARSHFQLYLDGMAEMGADVAPAVSFVERVRGGMPWREAMAEAGAPDPAQAFCRETFRPLDAGDLAGVAASFALGREEVIPVMFQHLVDELAGAHPGRLDTFRLYLKRHIELDGDDHGPQARRLLARCCGDDDAAWQRAARAAAAALTARAALWDGVLIRLGSGRAPAGTAPRAARPCAD